MQSSLTIASFFAVVVGCWALTAAHEAEAPSSASEALMEAQAEVAEMSDLKSEAGSEAWLKLHSCSRVLVSRAGELACAARALWRTSAFSIFRQQR